MKRFAHPLGKSGLRSLVHGLLTVVGLGGFGMSLAAGSWPFDLEVKASDRADVYQAILLDRVTVGLLRSAIAAVVIYILFSVPALVASGRWMRGLGASGLTTDDAQRTDEVIVDLQAQITSLQEENDALLEELSDLGNEESEEEEI